MSNPQTAYENAKRYLGKDVIMKFSTRQDKKYMILTPENKWIHFGQEGYDDYTKHQDKERQQRYLKRSANIKGDWRHDPYSPNNLSRNILWQ